MKGKPKLENNPVEINLNINKKLSLKQPGFVLNTTAKNSSIKIIPSMNNI